MATLFVTEWQGVRESKGGAQAPYGFIKTNNVTIGGSHAESAVFDPQCGLIEIGCDAICSYVVGLTPVATAANMRMPADTSGRFIAVNGGKDQISTISNT